MCVGLPFVQIKFKYIFGFIDSLCPHTHYNMVETVLSVLFGILFFPASHSIHINILFTYAFKSNYICMQTFCCSYRTCGLNSEHLEEALTPLRPSTLFSFLVLRGGIREVERGNCLELLVHRCLWCLCQEPWALSIRVKLLGLSTFKEENIPGNIWGSLGHPGDRALRYSLSTGS